MNLTEACRTRGPPTPLTLPTPLPRVQVILPRLDPRVRLGRPKAGVLVMLKASKRASRCRLAVKWEALEQRHVVWKDTRAAELVASAYRQVRKEQGWRLSTLRSWPARQSSRVEPGCVGPRRSRYA